MTHIITVLHVNQNTMFFASNKTRAYVRYGTYVIFETYARAARVCYFTVRYAVQNNLNYNTPVG